ncbi:MAG: FKBP-type peptidyl-prolyl cis-trans isomerase [Gemmatimonadaceae bacterium]
MRIQRLLSLVLPLTLAACLSGTTDPVLATVETTTFAPALGVDLATSTKTASGLYYRDITVGTGTTLARGQRVGVYYDGYFSDGTRFDHLLASDATPAPAPFSFTLGSGQVIFGFDEGVTGMKIGGMRQIIIPPALAYGYQRNDVLIFNVEAISAQ